MKVTSHIICNCLCYIVIANRKEHDMKYGIEVQYSDPYDDTLTATEVIAIYDNKTEAQKIVDYLNEHNSVDTHIDYFRVIEIAYNPTLDAVIAGINIIK